MINEIEKSEPSPDDVLAAIQSFNDPTIITNIFSDLGWSYSLEIKETLSLAKQNANLSIKFKAIKHLRELLREAAEASGYVANVSTTAPNAHGGHTTFSAKRISGILNPVKKIESIEIKESQNDKIEEPRTEPNRGSDREEGERPQSPGKIHERVSNGTDTRTQFPSENERDTGRANSDRDADSGGTEPPDGGETPGTGRNPIPAGTDGENNDSEKSNPCIKTRPPSAGSEDLFPGISSKKN